MGIGVWVGVGIEDEAGHALPACVMSIRHVVRIRTTTRARARALTIRLRCCAAA